MRTGPTAPDPPSFVVFDLDLDRYVADIDAYDGDVDFTDDPRQARIFRGQTWADHWAAPRYSINPEPTKEARCRTSPRSATSG